jgi:hypothetical protein
MGIAVLSFQCGEPLPATAWPYHGVSNCPEPNDPSSLCVNSPGGNFKVTEASLRQSGQTWLASANWNRCGLDYNCGYYNLTKRADQINTVASACTYNATGGSGGGPKITCSAINNLDIEGVDFTNTGGGTGTNCVPLDIQSGQTGTITIKNNKFVQSGSNCTSNTNGIGSWLMDAENASGANLDFESNNVDGGKSTTLTFCIVASTQAGNVTIKYNVLLHCNEPPIEILNTTAAPNITSAANFGEGIIYVLSAHGELWTNFFKPNGVGGSGGSVVTAWTSTADTIVVDSDNAINGWTTYIYPEGDNSTCQPGLCSFATVTLDHMFGIGNTNSGSNIISRAVEISSAAYTNLTISNSLFDFTGTNVAYIAGGTPGSYTGNTHGTTTVDNLSPANLSSANIGQLFSSSSGDIPAGDYITAVPSASSATLTSAATGTHTGQSITLYNTYCVNPATFTNNVSLTTGNAVNSWTVSAATSGASGPGVNNSLGC